jgi:SulP family sulfate permease
LERNNPDLKFIMIAANGINHLDASGVEMLRSLVKRLREVGITLVVSGAKKQVLDVMERTGLLHEIGEANVFSADKLALDALLSRVGNRAVPGNRRPQ